jgi:hypothetical protein
VVAAEQPQRWIQRDPREEALDPIIDEKGHYVVSKKPWPTGEVAYRTPPPPDHLAPRFGYNIVQVKKAETWWQHYHKYPRLSVAYVNIHLAFLLGLAWVVAFLNDEYRSTLQEMNTPGALVGDQRGRGAPGAKTQKVSFSTDEMTALMNSAQSNWLDAKGDATYIGSREYKMRQIARPKELTVEELRRR